MRELNKRIQFIEMPDRMKHLKISDEGYPVPWFVPWINGKPEFRGMDGEKFAIAVKHKKCWLCGETLGVHITFVIGPMCAVTRVSAEPPSHYICALYAAQACPFLSQPKMRRNEKDRPEGGTVAGIMIKRNPGVTLLWTCRDYKWFRDHDNKGILFTIGDHERIEFWSEGRKATLEEVMHSIDTGLPSLLEHVHGPEEEAEFNLRVQKTKTLVETTLMLPS